MNILITAIGSMSAKSVIESLKNLDNVSLIGCDIHDEEYLPLAQEFDRFYQIKPATDQFMIEELLKICSRSDVDIIFPLTDPEVDRLSEAAGLFESKNIKIAAPAPETVKLCRNKKLFYEKLKDVAEIQVIPTFDKNDIRIEDIHFPIIAKPATGRSSQGLFEINNEQFLHCLADIDDYIFQEILPGNIITVDILADKQGNFFSLARKELIRSANGAGLTVEVIPTNEHLQNGIEKICSGLNITGCVNIEFIENGNAYYLMDINPRFSAGVAFSKLAGYDFPGESLKVFTNTAIRIPEKKSIQYGVFGKYFKEKIMEETGTN